MYDRFNGDQVMRARFMREVEATRRVATFSTARVQVAGVTHHC
jgi:hypothetical protein